MEALLAGSVRDARVDVEQLSVDEAWTLVERINASTPASSATLTSGDIDLYYMSASGVILRDGHMMAAASALARRN